MSVYKIRLVDCVQIQVRYLPNLLLQFNLCLQYFSILFLLYNIKYKSFESFFLLCYLTVLNVVLAIGLCRLGNTLCTLVPFLTSVLKL